MGLHDPNATLGSLARRVAVPAIFVVVASSPYLLRGKGACVAPETAVEEAAPAGATTLSLEGEALGTTWSVQLIGEDLPDSAVVRSLVDAQLGEVDEQMSTWRRDSELSRFNATQGTEPMVLSAEHASVLRSALEVHEASGGAFDITVRPLLRRWGFGSGSSAPESAPDEAELQALRDIVGSDKLTLDDETPSLSKSAAQVEVDLSAIAKGFAVDEVSRALLGAGHANHLVEIGGEIQARGTNSKGQPWRLGVETPDASSPLSRSVETVVPLSDQAMATSGDYRDYREVDGIRVSHTIDPRTGLPIRHGLASVTVLHESCTLADAWATALNVLGPDEGLTVAEREGLSALLLVRQSDGTFVHRPSAAYTAHMQTHAADSPR